MNDQGFYDRALRRIERIGMGLGVAGALYGLIFHGPRFAAGFLCGASLSLFSFYTLRRLAELLSGGASATEARGSTAVFAMLFGLRYFLVGAAVYVIVKILEISRMPVLAGLFVAAAAVIVEILYELAFSL